jgi:hypothetical protein
MPVDIKYIQTKGKQLGLSQDEIDAYVRSKSIQTAPPATKKTTVQPPVTSTSSIPSNPSSIFEKISNFLAPRTTAIAKDAIASYEAGGYTADMNSRAKQQSDMALAIRNEKDPVKKKQLVAQSRALSGQATPDAPEFSQDTQKQIAAGQTGKVTDYVKRGAQTGLEVGSYLVPFGKGANIATKALLPGAVAGAMSAASDDRNIVEGAVGGAAGAGVMNAAGKVAGKVLKGGAKTLMDRVFKEPLKDTRSAVKAGQTLGEEVLNKGAGGLTDDGIYKSSVEAINKLEDELQTKLSGSKRTILVGEIRQAVDELVQKFRAAGDEASANAITQRIDALEKFHGKEIPASAANEVKRTLYDEARKAYGQMSTTSMEGVKAIARAIKESIGNKVEGVSEINQKLSFEGRKADAILDRITKGSRNNVIGLTDTIAGAGGFAAAGPAGVVPVIGKKLIETTPGSVVTAKIANKTGKVASKLADNPAVIQAGARVGANAPTLDLQQTLQPQDVIPSDQTTQTEPSLNLNQQVEQGGGSGFGIDQEEAQMLMAMDIQKTGGKNLAKIKQLYDIGQMGKPKAKGMTEKQAAYESAAQGGEYALKLLQGGGVSTGFGQGIMGAIGEKLGTNSDTQTDYRSTVAGVRTILRNAMLGANMSAGEMESLGPFIPDFNDPPNVAQQKLKTFIRLSRTFSAQEINNGVSITSPVDVFGGL